MWAAVDVLALVLSFSRNVVFARLLTTHDYGVCMVLAASVNALSIATDLGIEKMLIQDRSENMRSLQATLTTLTFLRGTFLAVVILVLSEPLASFFGADDAVWAFRSLAAIVVVRGLLHLDYKRVQREFNFSQESWTLMVGAATDFIVGVIAVYFTRSFYAFPIAQLSGTVAAVITSHLVARRLCLPGWRFDIVKRAVNFGWPLMANGVVILLMMQADRAIVARFLDLEQVAIYGVCWMIVATPVLVGVRAISTVFLPFLSEVALLDARRFATRLQLLGDMCIVSVGAITVCVMLLAEQAIRLLFDVRYVPPHLLVVALALGQAAIFLRSWSVLGALSIADTRNLLLSNAVRVVGFCLALAFAALKADLIWIAAGLAIGEYLSLAYSSARLGRRSPGVIVRFLPLLGILVVAIIICIFLARYTASAPLVIAVGTTAGILAAFLLTCGAIAGDVREFVGEKLRNAVGK